jgi:hypothetical protein
MREALKEWAAIVDALHRGEQSLIVRKGGLRDPGGRIAPGPDRFWLYPTAYHAQAVDLVEPAASRAAALCEELQRPEVHLRAWAECVARHELPGTLDPARLDGLHLWTRDALRRKWDWGAAAGATLLVLRVHRTPSPIVLTRTAEHGGCRSWIEVGDTPCPDPMPVLSDSAFETLRETLRERLPDIPPV